MLIGKFRGVAAVLGGVAALAALGGTSARAQQYNDPALSHDFALKLGVYIPSNKQVRQSSGTELFSAEADYVIQRYAEKSFVSVASIGYIDRGDFRMTPLTVGQIYRDPGNHSGFNYFYGYGLGIYPTSLSTSDGESSGKTKILFGAHVTTGIDWTDRIFTELKYHYLFRYDNKYVGGFQLSLGTRF